VGGREEVGIDAVLHDADAGGQLGRGGPDCISVAYQGAGLKIWASWSYPNIVTDRPLFQGRATVSMAREIYRIPDPANRQQSLF